MNFSIKYKEKINYIDEYISGFLSMYQNATDELIDSMKYSVLNGGKRLRSVLCIEICSMLGGNVEKALPFACAIELIHAYSLVHDDLPEMDNDEFRRGMPTTHVKFGQAMAVLAGDGLLNYAYEIVASAIINSSSPYKAAIAFDMLSRYAGIYGMIGGQTVDVMSVNGINDKETLDFIYELKTGALIKASMVIGALLGGADENQLQIVEDIADKVGMAFQIQDDILDVTSSTDELGKPVLSDEKNNKFTYVSLLGLEAASEYVSVLSEAAIKDLKELGLESEFLEELINYLINRKN